MVPLCTGDNRTVRVFNGGFQSFLYGMLFLLALCAHCHPEWCMAPSVNCSLMTEASQIRGVMQDVGIDTGCWNMHMKKTSSW